MTLAERRGLRLFTLAILFFAQGIPWGFMAFTLPAYLAAQDVGDAARGTLSAMTTWPFVFKWLWGPMMDGVAFPRFGRRRPWIVAAQLMMAVTVASLLAIGDFVEHIGVLIALVLVHTSFNAMQNVATDGLAIDLLEPRERGRASGVMYGCKYAGGALGAAGMAWLADATSLRWAIALQTLALAAIALVPLLVRERVGPPPPREPLAEVARTIGRVFRVRSTQIAAAAVFVMLLASGALSIVAQGLYIQELHWDPSLFAEIAGGPGLAVGFLGSLVAGALADAIGHRRLAGLASAVMAGGWLVFAAGEAWWTNRAFVGALFFVEPLAQSVMIVALWSLCMAASIKKIAATQFAIYTALMSLSSTVGSMVVAPLAKSWWEYRWIYVIAAGVQVGAIALLPFIDVEQARRAIADDEPR